MPKPPNPSQSARAAARRARPPREPRAPVPLDPARLNELALGYVARFATSAGRLNDYLRRKLRAQGWAGEGDQAEAMAETVARMVDAGYIDDAAFARSRADGLLRRGYGARRIAQALGAAGIDEAIRLDAAPDMGAGRQAALALARKRRWGPFGDTPMDPARRQKQTAAMLRAGHGFDAARALIDAASVIDAQAWAVPDAD